MPQITQEVLTREMVKQMQNLNKKGINNLDIKPQTVHSAILSATDGYGPSNSKNIYRGVITWFIVTNGAKRKRWPKDWFDLSIQDLATQLV